MPIGVPRIIYCWGEELPAQWTDIYNFIFRRRMIFLMQYLDDELCNQICGLLINIHMEDRSKELEKKETEKSNVFKKSTKAGTTKTMNSRNDGMNPQSINTQKSIQDLLISEEDLAIDENYQLEQYTLQKITLDWLNWTANFFDYANEPYLFYLTEILAKDFIKDNGNLLYKVSEVSDLKLKNNKLISDQINEVSLNQQNQPAYKSLDKISLKTQENSIKSELASLIFTQRTEDREDFINQNLTQGSSILQEETRKTLSVAYEGSSQRANNMGYPVSKDSEISKFLGIFKAMVNSSILSSRLKNQSWTNQIFEYWTSWSGSFQLNSVELMQQNYDQQGSNSNSNNYNSILILEKLNQHENVYSPFRFLANFASNDYKFNALKTVIQQEIKNPKQNLIENKSENLKEKLLQQLKMIDESNITNRLVSRDIVKELTEKHYDLKKQTHKTLWNSTKKGLGQRILKNQYRQDKIKWNSDSSSMKNSVQEKSKINSSDQNLLNTNINRFKIKNAKNYLNLNYFSSTVKNSSLTSDQSQNQNSSELSLNKKNPTTNVNTFRRQSERTLSYRKQTERTLQEEELKKVFVIINSFGGSVGNGITVHDALQFIKAGSLTLALGVAASAASLALAGGTIGERYITEGCHTMIHQPEGSINGQASDILIDSNEIMKIRLDVAEIYSLSTYRPRHKILRDLDRDFYLTATETVYYGLADEIATNEVMQDIIEMTNQVWEYHESKQQSLLEIRERSSSGLDTLTQS